MLAPGSDDISRLNSRRTLSRRLALDSVRHAADCDSRYFVLIWNIERLVLFGASDRTLVDLGIHQSETRFRYPAASITVNN